VTVSAFLYLILSALGFSIVLPPEDVSLVERAAFVSPGELPVGVCGVTITTYWPDGSRPNDDEIRITFGPNATDGCRVDFLPTAILHEVSHVKCNELYREWMQAAPDPAQAAEECAWYFVWLYAPYQTARIYLPPDYVPVAPQ
jgi:hypothetical protein